MLAEVRDAGDAKKMMDLASAAEHYAKKARLGEESIKYAHEIKTDAEALLGEFLARSGSNHQPPPNAVGFPPSIQSGSSFNLNTRGRVEMFGKCQWTHVSTTCRRCA